MPIFLRFRSVLLAEFAYILLLLPLPWLLSWQQMRWLFSEQGPFEVLSAVLWAVLGVLCLLSAKRGPRRLISCGIAGFLGCARELDLHTAITGMSIFKSHYYLKTPAPIAQKLLVGALAIAILALLIDVLLAGLRAMRHGAPRQDWMCSALLGFVTTTVTKGLDKAEAFTRDLTGHHLPQSWGLVVAALEEGVEMSLPLLFIVALVQYRRMQAQHALAT
ncbi:MULTISPECIES: hypothetical protein [Hydrocarboniphaga]|uniref:hypothetical protein n=1 Tax=Hydrocarboniphaga TaxID=243627 RepID=UPI002ABAFDA3|nr:hypothetical protein [Hydrocarboniphaga sp.]MDZ4079364.1 hypothetical protein [Hydrocarboniphaga sp.]